MNESATPIDLTANVPAAENSVDLDHLLPPTRPWWSRAILGLLTLSLATALGFGLGWGYLYPKANVGEGGGSTGMQQAGEDTVRTGVQFFNSSGRSLEVTAATVSIPGAEVVDVAPAPMETMDNIVSGDPLRTTAFPTVVAPDSTILVMIEFRPLECPDRQPRAEVSVELRLADPAFPPFSRTVPVAADNWQADTIDPASGAVLGDWVRQACTFQAENQ